MVNKKQKINIVYIKHHEEYDLWLMNWKLYCILIRQQIFKFNLPTGEIKF